MTTAPPTSRPILEVRGATSRASNGTTLLDDVSFAVEAGWLVAVVGPTGAGKTSLAKALLGQLRLDAGTVSVQGRGHVAGVPQDDATHAQLTLRRTLDHAAALRVGAKPGERRRRVDAMLAELGLAGRASTRLADLSGGERKRANVAVELLGEPDLLVLDEPTAGLDPAFERSVFASLRTLANDGRTIVAITHSMQVLTVCDRVLFLAPGGTVAFFGSPAEAKDYFAWDEPADAYAALATEPDGWRERFSTHQASRDPVSTASTITPPPAWRPRTANWDSAVGGGSPRSTPPASAAPCGHVGTLLRRSWHLATSDRRALALTLTAGPVLGILLWAVLPGGTLGRGLGADGQPLSSGHRAETFAFFLAMTITWLGAAGAVREVVKERHILRRERLVGVSLSSYLTGKALFLSAVTAVQVVPLTAIALLGQQAPMGGPALGSALLEILVVAVVVAVAAVATGLLVSAWASSSEKAMTALPVVLIASLALAGPWAEGRGPSLAVLRDLIPARWAAVAVQATVSGDAGRWWLGLAALAGLAAAQLGAALALLRHTSPSPAAAGAPLDSFTTRLSSASPATARLLPIGIAVVVALAAGVGAFGRSGSGHPGTAASETVALGGPAKPSPTPAPPPAPTTVAVPPRAAPVTTTPPAPPSTVAAARPAPTPAPPRTTPPTTSRTSAPAPTAPPPLPTTPPTTT
ncbi:MAG: ATP-binding cassette domain-containing protein, partial [Acidimicrobiales bacterium]